MTRALLQLLPASRLLAICLVGALLIVVMMPLHAFVSTWGGTAIGPLWLWKSWKELLIVLLAVVFAVWLWRHRAQRREFLHDHLVLLIGMYALLTVQWALLHAYETGWSAAAAGVAMNLRYIVLFTVVYGVFRYGGLDYAAWRRLAGRFVLAAGVVLAGLGLLQVTVVPKDFLANFGYDKSETIAPFILIDENEGARRAFATLRGPNDYGAFLILPLVLAAGLLWRRRWLAGLAGGVIVLGLVASGSRSAWLGALAALGTLLVLLLGRRLVQSRIAWAGVAVGAVAAFGLTYAALHVPALRLAIFHSSPGDSSLTEGSTDAHWQATADGVKRVLEDPLGCGTGCAGPASYYSDTPRISENYYVQVAEETGVFGLALWAAIAAVLTRRLYRQRADWLARGLLASGAGLAAIGFWLHVWSDDPLSLTWWALAGMACGAAAQNAGQRSKNQVS